MSVKVEIKNDDFEPGTEFFVDGLGTLVNGKEVSFSAEQVESFEAREGKKIKDAFKDSPNVKVVGTASKEGGS